MFKNLILVIITISLVSINAYAGSDGELTFNKEQPEKIKDCFEKLNRVTFSFNQKIDKSIIKPVAKSYRNLPDPIQKSAGNAVTNLSNLITIPNNILQGDMRTAIINTARLAVNSTLGLFGTIDVANKLGFPKYEKEDYGQTLGTWGFGPGCYFVLPVLGPSTIRDTAGSFANVLGGDAWYNVTVANDTQHFTDFDYYASRASSGIDFRAKNIDSFENLEKNSMDFYASVRSLYLQDRQLKIVNSNAITETQDDSDWEEIETQ